MSNSTRFKPKYNIKKGDTVVVIAGADKDLKNPKVVTKVLLEEGRVIVEGVNLASKHVKPNAKNTKGGIVKKELPIHISNVMLWDSKVNAPTRITREKKDGHLVRISKKSKEIIK
ncbi:MAG: 50S ribosomal protein L24 [Phycisphaerales bacterium]|nr:50S ribosomal protein L24 [Phycisphaerales bacterium]